MPHIHFKCIYWIQRKNNAKQRLHFFIHSLRRRSNMSHLKSGLIYSFIHFTRNQSSSSTFIDLRRSWMFGCFYFNIMMKTHSFSVYIYILYDRCSSVALSLHFVRRRERAMETMGRNKSRSDNDDYKLQTIKSPILTR